ncbi:MAG: arylesterase [Acidobacteria bacterium]|nr:arylesterase [Acidobacteriota bacterium]
MRSLSVLVLSALSAFGCRPEVPNLDSPGTVIVAFGDSITYGAGASAEESYPAALAGRLGVEVINAGVPGETSRDGFLRLEEVLSLDPWLVIVEFGGNDLLQRRPLEETEASLREIVEGLLDERVVPVLVEIHGPLNGDKMEGLFEEISDAYDIPLIRDVLPEILRTPALKSDPIHPNSRGYAVLAEEVGEVVEDLLAARGRNL